MCHAQNTLIKTANGAYFSLCKDNDKRLNPRVNGKEKKMNIARSFNDWRKARRTYNELSRLSTRELDDLGISRGDIADIARRSVRG